ncbi:enoyl-CoA hydratase/isomerase family protein [Vineibacter terrae]|uniref:Enoyl-CoA hydratase/isomerase family protein n=1 Tax=Vineibacter terrae TaxID=2586908 RepID=A0A5C8PIM7_9HYPH|nr:enoyl-CoA hydratase-related protein [Vineibacter terrae]TXL73665.1 enoyl-CoA hydratase/isomerase family protein [Vineibacter terrae]
MSEHILLTIDGPRATITLNNPAVHNRLAPADIKAFIGHLDTIDAATDLRVLVVTGAGEKTFCAGFDLGSLRPGVAASPDDGGGDGRRYSFEILCDRLEASRVPTIGALNGSVYGGGTDLALACDFRVGIRGMRAFLPAGRLGLHYYPSGLRRFTERLGPGVAKRFLLLAEEFDGNELHRIGYLDWLVERAALAAKVDGLAATASGLAPLSLAGMKASINDIACSVFDEDIIRQRIRTCAMSEDLVEGIAAVNDKRKPVFRGR